MCFSKVKRSFNLQLGPEGGGERERRKLPAAEPPITKLKGSRQLHLLHQPSRRGEEHILAHADSAVTRHLAKKKNQEIAVIRKYISLVETRPRETKYNISGFEYRQSSISRQIDVQYQHTHPT